MRTTRLAIMTLLLVASALSSQIFAQSSTGTGIYTIDVLGTAGQHGVGYGYRGDQPVDLVFAKYPGFELDAPGMQSLVLTILEKGQNSLTASAVSASAAARVNWLGGGISATSGFSNFKVVHEQSERLVVTLRYYAETGFQHADYDENLVPTPPLLSSRFATLLGITDPIQAGQQIAAEFGSHVAVEAKGVLMYQLTFSCETQSSSERSDAFQALSVALNGLGYNVSGQIQSQSSFSGEQGAYEFNLSVETISGDGSLVNPPLPAGNVMSATQLKNWFSGSFWQDFQAWQQAATPAVKALKLYPITSFIPNAAISVVGNPLYDQLRNIFNIMVTTHLDRYLEVVDFKSRVDALLNASNYINPAPTPTWIADTQIYSTTLEDYAAAVRGLAFQVVNATSLAELNTLLSAIETLQAPPIQGSLFNELETACVGNPAAYIEAAQAHLLGWQAEANARWLLGKYGPVQTVVSALNRPNLTIESIVDAQNRKLTVYNLVWLPAALNVQTVTIRNTSLLNFDGIDRLANLETLRLESNGRVSDFSALASVAKLRELTLKGNGKLNNLYNVDLTFLDNAWRLETLIFDDQQINANELDCLTRCFFIKKLQFRNHGYANQYSQVFFKDVLTELSSVADAQQLVATHYNESLDFLADMTLAEQQEFGAKFALRYNGIFGNSNSVNYSGWTQASVSFDSVQCALPSFTGYYAPIITSGKSNCSLPTEVSSSYNGNSFAELSLLAIRNSWN